MGLAARVSQYVKRVPSLVWLALVGLGVYLLLSSCRPAPLTATGWRDPKPVLTVSAVRTGLGTFKVVLVWHYQSDPNGAPDSVITSAAVDPTGSQFQSHRHRATVVRDSFPMTSTPGVAMTGYGCARTKRRGNEGQNACKPWAYTEPDVPPLPPVMDSVKVSALEVVPGSVTMIAGAAQWFCALLVFETGQKALVGGQRGQPACDSVEAALPLAQRPTAAQYAAAGEWLSCGLDAGVKKCRHADGSVTVPGSG